MSDEEPEGEEWYDNITKVPKGRKAIVFITDQNGDKIPVRGRSSKELVITKADEIAISDTDVTVDVDDGSETRKYKITKLYHLLTNGSPLYFRAIKA